MRMKPLFAIFWKGMLMDIKFTHILNALAKLRDEVGAKASENIVLEVTMVPDDPGSGKMIECLALKCTTVEQASNYDSFKSEINRQYTVEIFADNEKRVP